MAQDQPPGTMTPQEPGPDHSPASRNSAIRPRHRSGPRRAEGSQWVALAVMAGAFALAFLLSLTPGARRVELSLEDLRQTRYAAKFALHESPIVVVEIDDESDEMLHGVWPWPRSYYARLVRNLARAGARAVVIDVVLDKPRPDYAAADDSLAAALRETPSVVLAGKTWVPDVDRAGIGLTVRYSDGTTTGTALLIRPYGKFLGADGANWGLADVKEDLDGVVREYYLRRAVAEGGREYATLAARALEVLGLEPPPWAGEGETFRIAFPGGARTFPYVSFYQVVDDSTLWTRDEQEWGEENNWFAQLERDGVFRDKIVLVGATMAELHDMKHTPFSVIKQAAEPVPGVEVHAAALHTLMNGYRIRAADPVLSPAAALALCLGVLALGLWTRAWAHVAAAAVAAGLWTAAGFIAYERYSVLIPMAAPVMAIVLTTGAQLGYLFVVEQRRRRLVISMFGHYVPPEVVRQLVRDPAKMRLGGERRELSVLFSDVAGFTSISEAMEPERLVELLNEYLTAMTAIVHAHGGIIDKYEGDAVMAEFGIPLAMEDHALRACNTAFLMQKRLHELRDKWEVEGKPLLRARVGIGSGTMVFGNMGSDQAFDYTVMGDVVNLASRLEGANKNYGTYVMVNERANELVREVMYTREMDLLRVKGKEIPERCFQVMAPRDTAKGPQIDRVCELFAAGLARYRAQCWADAIERFEQALGVWPDDEPSKVYIGRCQAFAATPPAQDWDGVFVMTTK